MKTVGVIEGVKVSGRRHFSVVVERNGDREVIYASHLYYRCDEIRNGLLTQGYAPMGRLRVAR